MPLGASACDCLACGVLLSAIAGNSETGDIGKLITECMTPAGINEQAMATINENGGFASLSTALDRVKQKIG